MIESEPKGKEVESNANFDETITQLNEAVFLNLENLCNGIFLFVFLVKQFFSKRLNKN